MKNRAVTRNLLFIPAVLTALALAVSGCKLVYAAYLGEETVVSLTANNMDLTGVIPAPVSGAFSSSTYSYKGNYSVGPVTWMDATADEVLTSPASFILGHTYIAAFTLRAVSGHNFTNLSAGIWKSEAGASTTNFYHTGALTVEQSENTGSSITITMTFPPVLGIDVVSLDLTGVISAPISGDAPIVSSDYSGEYTAGTITWTDVTPGTALPPPTAFTAGHTYKAAFTLSARSDRGFAGLEAGTWTPTSGTPSMTNFYHTGAASVVQANNTGETIGITITFPPALGISVTSLDLTRVIPVPVGGDIPLVSSSYSGEYTLDDIHWSGAALEEGKFALGGEYTAGFTMHAKNGRSFEGLPVGMGAGTWTPALGAPSTTNFYHTGAVSVRQVNNTGDSIQITIAFKRTMGISASSLDLTDVIPAPADRESPGVSPSYSGGYTVGDIDWMDVSTGTVLPVNPVASFIPGHTYAAGFILTAASGRSFAGLESGTWTAGTTPVPSTINFYHFGASVVAQAAPSGGNSTIVVTITFLPVEALKDVNLDLTEVIPRPVMWETPASASAAAYAYRGDYRVQQGTLVWTPFAAVFVAGVVYQASFTLNAEPGYTFTGAGAFTHQWGTVAVTSGNRSSIGVTITFVEVAELYSVTPQGEPEVIEINADATEVRFNLAQEYSGAWKVYTTAEGGGASTTVAARCDVIQSVPCLILESDAPIAPRTYYVSLTESGGLESTGRLALWGEPLDGSEAMSLAKRFRLAERQGIDDALLGGPAGPGAVFSVLHAYLADPVVYNKAITAPYTVPGIALGDWVDLPSLAVAEYSDIGGGINIPTNTDLGDHGKLLRLIVVGNNSFHFGKGVDSQYTVTANDAAPHLVFQFQNIPGFAKMQTGNAGGGYKGSGMRGYLVPTDDPNSGKFLAGLKNAGVPEDWLFAPKRYVTNDGQRGNSNAPSENTWLATAADEILDKVWLPTEWELFGVNHYSNGDPITGETAANQARLEYYTGATEDEANAKRVKYNSGGNADYYREASPGQSDSAAPDGTFCLVMQDGAPDSIWPNYVVGFAPAFCVK